MENCEFDVALSKQVGHVNNIPTMQVFTGISRNTQSKPLYAIIGMYLHGFEKRILPDINKRSSLGERWEQAEA